jgi:hypothetical protein
MPEERGILGNALLLWEHYLAEGKPGRICFLMICTSQVSQEQMKNWGGLWCMSENESLVRSQHFAFQNIVPIVEEKIHCRKLLQKHYEISRSAH